MPRGQSLKLTAKAASVGRVRNVVRRNKELLAPFNSVARNNLGLALNRLAKHDEALNQLRVAASHDPLKSTLAS